MSSSPYPQSDRDLLNRIGRSPGAKAGYKQLVRELGLGGGRARRLLLEQLARLVARGTLTPLAEQYWTLPEPSAAASASDYDKSTQKASRSDVSTRQATNFREGRDRFRTGRLELHRDGFGFVRLSSAQAAGRQDNGNDIFIPPTALYGAMHGDTVLVDEDAGSRDGRRSGRIARVLTRRNQTVVGIFHYGRRQRPGKRSSFVESQPQGNYVQPWDERLGSFIEIPPGHETVPTQASTPHRTLGAPAFQLLPQGTDDPDASKEVSGQQRWPLQGLAVEVELLSFAQAGRPAQGRVIDVLGPPDAFGVDVEIVIRKHAIPHTFPAHVLAEAQDRATLTVASLSEDEQRLREDFRHLPVVTIDGETARDFDDAVHIQSLANGNTELQVHIADVGSYVFSGSALDTEARVRGTSVYFPDRAVPMLPHELSSSMCSLLPEQDRLVLSCIMEIDAEGEITGYRVAEGIIRSARRMTYTSVQHCLNASPDASAWNDPVQHTPAPTIEDQVERERVALEQPTIPASLDRMLHLALALNRKRVRRGSIDFDLPEPIVEFDPDGNMKAIVRSERSWSHRLIEEFMLSANECVATWLTAQGIASLYRIHEMPDPKRVVDFEETAAAFGQTLGVGALPVKRFTMKSDRRDSQRQAARGSNSRSAAAHDLPERIPVTPQMYQRLIRRIEGKPEERILAYQMLRSLKQARYAEQNEGHFALASPCYTHFTSPIRRYPDLIVHRLLRAMLRGGAAPTGGPIHSGDPQPWKLASQQRSQGQRAPATAVALKRPAESKSGLGNRQTPHKSADNPDTQRKRAGRIGWAGALPATSSVAVDTTPLVTEALHPSGFEPISAAELQDIATESSQAERRAADAERELIEWKKMKFMADRIGDDFKGIILSVTKFGFFVELDELFIEGLVPLSSLTGDFYSFRDADRAICGARSGHCFRIGDRVEVLLDRIDHQQHRLQFALLPDSLPKPASGGLRAGKSEQKKAKAATKQKGARSSKSKAGRQKSRSRQG